MQAVKPRIGQVQYRDLREWLALVEGFGELTHVKGADWNLELGTISELNYRRKPVPALLFDEIKGCRPGFRVLTGATVDLGIFPVPFWHEHDGGRYIGTGSSVITCDPDTGATNVGAYRCMLIDD